MMYIDNTKKVCQYCGKAFDRKEHKKTSEHIFPNALIKLFPEQYIAFNDSKRFIDNRGITIADVCEKCNGGVLSSLDNYGSRLVHDNFFKEIHVDLKDEVFPIVFDYYKLSRWILKILYNFRRSKNKNVEWFHRALGYILQDIRIENIDFSIFAGVHINTTPLPEQFYEYKPLQINEEPKLIGNSLAVSSLGLDAYANSIKVNQAFATYSIRFGSLILYIILWDKSAELTKKNYFNELMTREFTFKQIISNKEKYNLRRVAAHSNTTMGYRHLISKSGIIQDDMFISNSIHGQSLSKCQKILFDSKGEEGILKTRALIEMDQFPNNTKIRKQYEKYYGKTDQ